MVSNIKADGTGPYTYLLHGVVASSAFFVFVFFLKFTYTQELVKRKSLQHDSSIAYVSGFILCHCWEERLHIWFIRKVFQFSLHYPLFCFRCRSGSELDDKEQVFLLSLGVGARRCTVHERWPVGPLFRLFWWMKYHRRCAPCWRGFQTRPVLAYGRIIYMERFCK